MTATPSRTVGELPRAELAKSVQHDGVGLQRVGLQHASCGQRLGIDHRQLAARGAAPSGSTSAAR